MSKHGNPIVHVDVRNILAAAVTIFLLIFFKSRLTKRTQKNIKNTSYSATLPYAQLIPFIKLPILNFFVAIYRFGKDGLTWAERLPAKLGPNFRLPAGFFQLVVVSEPALVQKILGSTSPGHLNKLRFWYDTCFTDLMKDGIVVAKYAVWSPHRKSVASALTYTSLQTYLRFMIVGASELTENARDAADKKCDGVICNTEMQNLIDNHTVQIITRIIMGSGSYELSNEQFTTFHANVRRWKEIALGRFYRPQLLIPLFWRFHSLKRELDGTVEEIRRICYQMSDSYRMRDKMSENVLRQQERMEEEALGIKPFECLVEKMIKAGLDNKEIADEVATFLVAGHETVTIALDMLIFSLASNVDHQEKCRAEVDGLLNRKPNNNYSNLTLEDFSQLKYLERCMLESLRLNSPIPMIARQLDAPLELENNLEIKAGESILIPIFLVHKNPKIYPNPDTFDPDRFLPENIRKRHSHSFIPFSLGMRNCIGWKIAMLEMKVIMTWMLRHFEMTTTDKASDVKLFFDLTIKSERSFNVAFKKRKFPE